MLKILWSFVLLSVGCAPVLKVRPPVSVGVVVPAPPSLPKLEKTFGEVLMGAHGSLAIRYKALAVLLAAGTDTMEAGRLRQEGFAAMKEVKTGQRVMIQKNDDFVFVTKLPTQATLLEFDNGRNLFLSGDLTDENALREIVYALRDDGKEIYEGFFYPAPGQNEESLARAISLIQPKNALIVQAEVNSSPVMNESTLRAALKDELYEGPMAILNDKQNIPF